MFTKQDVLATKEEPAYLDLDGIDYDLDGQHLAEFLHNEGFVIIAHYDANRNGVVIFKDDNGDTYKMSTSGWCRSYTIERSKNNECTERYSRTNGHC